MEHYASFQQICGQLAAIIKAQQSGVFFIATDANESARLKLNAGKMTHCSFRRFHGQEALAELLQIETAKCSFAENSRFPFRDNDNIEHEAALQTLGFTAPVAENMEKPEQTLAVETENQPEVEMVTRIYRGKVIQVAARPKNKEAKRTKKGQRIYRGKVIKAD